MAFELTIIKRQIHKIANKIKTGQPIYSDDILPLMRPLSTLATRIMQRKDYYQVKSFCAGLADAFSKADELKKLGIFKETMIPINGIKKITSDFLGKKKDKVEEEYGDINTIKVNIRDLLNQLNASLKAVVIPQLRKAVAA